MRRSAALLALLLSFYCCRDEALRVELHERVKNADDFARQWRSLLWPPWRPLLIYVSLDSDVHLYFEYTRLILGEQADLQYIADRHHEDPRAELLARQAEVARTPSGVRLPYRDVTIEYPPAALLMMLAPRLVVHSYAAYNIAYAVLAALLYLLSWLLSWLALRRGHLGLSGDEVLRRAAIVTAALGPILVSRLDVLSSLLLVAAVLALVAERPLVSGILLLLGAAAKLFPLLLLPLLSALLFGAGKAGRRRLLAVYGGLVLGALGLLGICAVMGIPSRLLLGSFGFYGDRPIQIESLVGAVAMALGAEVHTSFGSVNVMWPGSEALVRIWGPVMGFLILIHAALAWRWASRQRELPMAALVPWFGSGLCLIWLTTKVLSPQYLLWGVPILAVLPGTPGKRQFHWLVAALALTQAFFPLLYWSLQHGWPPAVALLLARNAALCWLAWLALCRAREAL